MRQQEEVTAIAIKAFFQVSCDRRNGRLKYIFWLALGLIRRCIISPSFCYLCPVLVLLFVRLLRLIMRGMRNKAKLYLASSRISTLQIKINIIVTFWHNISSYSIVWKILRLITKTNNFQKIQLESLWCEDSLKHLTINYKYLPFEINRERPPVQFLL